MAKWGSAARAAASMPDGGGAHLIQKRYGVFFKPRQRGGGFATPHPNPRPPPSHTPAPAALPSRRGAAVSSLCYITPLRHLLPPVPFCLGFRMRPRCF
jgi:hypothetical protein